MDAVDTTAPAAVMKPKVAVDASEAEVLRHDPLKNYKALETEK